MGSFKNRVFSFTTLAACHVFFWTNFFGFAPTLPKITKLMRWHHVFGFYATGTLGIFTWNITTAFPINNF
jgi:hypothetical protein